MHKNQEALDGMKATLREWRRSHPTATFAQMEQAVEEQLARVRSQLLAELAGEEDRSMQLCPQCGRRMQHRGERDRDLEIPGGVPVELTRSYLVCPQCQLGLFPPGRAAGPAPR